jgi:ABC-type lipoprotein release transport system permease subunit
MNEISPEDTATIALAAGFLFLVSMTAGFIAVWSATLINPVRALRAK